MGDPLFADGIDATVVLIVVAKVVVAFTILLVGVILMIWFERKVIADMQNRIGPNRAGKWGLLQTVADGIKLIFKEDIRPDRSDPLVYRLAPYLAAVPPFLVFCVVPIGGVFGGGQDGTVELFGRTTYLQVADPPVGVLFILAMSSIAVYGVMLAGWSSGSKYPLLGSVRASAQMVSYEAALGLSLAAVVLITGALSTHAVVADQSGPASWSLTHVSSWLTSWNVLRTGVVPFVIFCIAATAELNRPPFDLVEAEQELVGGFNTEYSSMRFGMFYLAEFMSTIAMSAVIVTLFLGGPAGPIPFGPGVLWSIFWFTAKVVVLLFTFVWLRATLPRFRYDQLMDLGWKALIPLALGWLLVLAGLRLGRNEWSTFEFVLAAAGGATVLCAAWWAIGAAGRVARANRADQEVDV